MYSSTVNKTLTNLSLSALPEITILNFNCLSKNPTKRAAAVCILVAHSACWGLFIITFTKVGVRHRCRRLGCGGFQETAECVAVRGSAWGNPQDRGSARNYRIICRYFIISNVLTPTPIEGLKKNSESPLGSELFRLLQQRRGKSCLGRMSIPLRKALLVWENLLLDTHLLLLYCFGVWWCISRQQMKILLLRPSRNKFWKSQQSNSAVERTSSSSVDLGSTFLNLDITICASLSALYWLFLNHELFLMAGGCFPVLLIQQLL